MPTTHKRVVLSSIFELAKDDEYGMVWVVSCPAGDAHLFPLDSHHHALAFARRKWFPVQIENDMTPDCPCDEVSRRG